ncbi:MAG TPA: hypothetical protein VLV55_10120 [Rhizomicrobium sp.]|nr:hypothetical protein [Rhizomicrobium sp.]
MAKTYRDIAVNGMLGTIEDSMREVLNCWVELPPEMQDALAQFRARLHATIDSVEFVQRALDREAHEGNEGASGLP